MSTIQSKGEQSDYSLPLIIAEFCLLGSGAESNCWLSGVVGIMLIVAALFA